ncbi:hypothetical protein B0H34DRAFT_692514 [Crassisporium funariophilum]|nr:hypothetical protein B0H34DRAFT_692514 [Crassisporium funariophilum]
MNSRSCQCSDVPPEDLIAGEPTELENAHAASEAATTDASASDSETSSSNDDLDMDVDDDDGNMERQQDLDVAETNSGCFDGTPASQSSTGAETLLGSPSKTHIESLRQLDEVVDESSRPGQNDSVDALATSLPRGQPLILTHQTEFNLEALPTRCGRPRRTRDMAEMYACMCGRVVEEEARVMGSKTAVRCAFEGCETSWFHLECLRLNCAPKGWRCEIHATRKRARIA